MLSASHDRSSTGTDRAFRTHAHETQTKVLRAQKAQKVITRDRRSSRNSDGSVPYFLVHSSNVYVAEELKQEQSCIDVGNLAPQPAHVPLDGASHEVSSILNT